MFNVQNPMGRPSLCPWWATGSLRALSLPSGKPDKCVANKVAKGVPRITLGFAKLLKVVIGSPCGKRDNCVANDPCQMHHIPRRILPVLATLFATHLSRLPKISTLQLCKEPSNVVPEPPFATLFATHLSGLPGMHHITRAGHSTNRAAAKGI